MRLPRFVFPAVLGVLVLVQFYLALIWSPPEQTMHDLVRIMYFHVASAWIAFLSFFVTFLFALLYLVRRNVTFDRIALCSAEIGVMYTTVTLISGSIWGKAVWQTWWTWDPRLTTTLILWFLYVGYLLLRGTVMGRERRALVSSIYALIAAVDLPIIHMSITWWNSIHPAVIDSTGFHMPGSMTFTLMFGFFVFFGIYLLLLRLRLRYESQREQLFLLRQQVREARALQSGVKIYG